MQYFWLSYLESTLVEPVLMDSAESYRTLPNQLELARIGKNWQKSAKIGKNRQELVGSVDSAELVESVDSADLVSVQYQFGLVTFFLVYRYRFGKNPIRSFTSVVSVVLFRYFCFQLTN